MSRKKPQPGRTSTPSPTAITSYPVGARPGSASPATAVTASPPAAKMPKPPAARPQPEERFWLAALAVRLSRVLGSLQLAVISLTLFAIVLAVGTHIESRYSGKVAQDLVYKTWWFTLLLGLLGTNIFFAAAKKWPWKKYQTGFLITHLGLLTMISGGLVNSLSGTDSLLVLVDSDYQDIQKREGAPQASNLMFDREAGLIRVRVPGSEKVHEYNFNPGSLPWHSDQYTHGPSDWRLVLLDGLAHPFPRTWGVDLSDRARLEVVNFYPHVRTEEYSPADDTANRARRLPALKVQLTSPRAGRIPGRWVAVDPDLENASLAAQVSAFGPTLVEMLGRCPDALLGEFLNPPDPEKLGPKGLLVVHCNGQTFPAIPVDARLDKGPVSLGSTGLKLTVVKYEQATRPPDEGDRGRAPEDPSVEFKISRGDSGPAATFRALARLAGYLVPVNREEGAPDLGDLRVWYHPPDYRYHNSNLTGVLQFVQREKDGKLFFRSFSSRSAFRREDSGPVRLDRAQAIWSGMNWQFRVLDYLPNAIPKTRYVPADLKPGSEVAGYAPAVLARLAVRGEKPKLVWLQQTSSLLYHPDQLLTRVRVGDQNFELGYSVQFRQLPFDLKLLRAEQEVDPGTQSPASYSSYVTLTDKAEGINGEDRFITMNHPLDHRGYKVYQSGYDSLGFDPVLRPVNRSTFTVGSDPGLPLKYAGTFMLAGGIACMFYMRAYFFKPRGRKNPAAARG